MSLSKQTLLIMAISFTLLPLSSPRAAPAPCPESFASFWMEFRKSIEKDRMKDIKFLSNFPVQLTGADGKQTKDLGPKEFQNLFYKILAEKCDVMDSKNQREWILKYQELPSKSAFYTCTKKWVQFCNFEFSLDGSRWHLTKISTTNKDLFQ